MRAPRFSIFRLMVAVLAAALGLTALRYASVRTAGVVFLLTCGVLALSVVGVVCRVKAERAGNYRVRFDLHAEGMPQPVSGVAATRVVEGGGAVAAGR